MTSNVKEPLLPLREQLIAENEESLRLLESRHVRTGSFDSDVGWRDTTEVAIARTKERIASLRSSMNQLAQT